MEELLEDVDYEDGEDGDHIVRVGDSDIAVSYRGLVNLLKRRDEHEKAGRLEEVVDHIQEKTPSFDKIISANVTKEHRAHLIELYEALKEIESACEQGNPCRIDYINLRNQIHGLLKKYERRKAATDKLDDDLRESFLRQKRELQESLTDSTDTMEERILSLTATSETKAVIYGMFKKLEGAQSDDDQAKIRSWLDWAVDMPHDKVTQGPSDPFHVTLLRLAAELDRELYGMKEVKEQILTYVGTRLCRPGSSSRGDVLGLCGPPGTGKTSISRLLMKVLSVPFTQISFGGITRPEFFTGFDYTYVGSRPGEIAQAMKRLGSKNGIIFMDEFEKATTDKATVSALLHIVDKEQNSEFRDHYLRDLTIDLSMVWFICSMNSLPTDSALKDRIYPVEVKGYGPREKVKILTMHILPKALAEAGLKEGSVVIPPEVAKDIVMRVSPDRSGARQIDNATRDIVRKLSFLEAARDSLKEYPFEMSFCLDEQVSFPFSLKSRHLSKLIKSSSDPAPSYMYL